MRIGKGSRIQLNVSTILGVVLSAIPFSCLGANAAEQFAAPIFSRPGGVYTDSFSLQITAAAPAVVRFTMNGPEPEESSPVCNSALVISNCAIIRAKALYPTGTSRAVCQNYTMLAEDVREFSSNLPLVLLNGGSAELTNTGKASAA